MAERAGIELPTVSKLLKLLAGAGLVESRRGVNGGYRLARSASSISVLDIVAAIEGPIGAGKSSLARKLAAHLGADLLLEVYDATYFSGYSFAGKDAVAFAGERQQGCTIKAGAPPSPQQTAAYKLTARQLGPEFVAKGVTLGAVAVTCPREGASIEAVGFAGGR